MFFLLLVELLLFPAHLILDFFVFLGIELLDFPQFLFLVLLFNPLLNVLLNIPEVEVCFKCILPFCWIQDHW